MVIQPTPTAQDNADTFLNDFLAHIAARQDAYSAIHGKYFQGISTHSVVPADGFETAPDLSVKPTDQAEDWDDIGFILPDTLPCAVEIHTYDGPLGKGYDVILTVEVNGQKWQRAKSTGPEAHYRVHAWYEVVENGDN